MANERKTTIGISKDLQPVLLAAMETGLFKEELHIARFAIALAIRRGKTGSDMKNATTKWNLGSFDGERKLLRVVSLLFPECDDPIRQAERLLRDGLGLLRDSQAGSSVPDFLRLVMSCNEAPIDQSVEATAAFTDQIPV